MTLLVAAVCVSSLYYVASRLSPDPRGFGTHQQLGLSECAFIRVTGRPCPTCGMTTAFSWFVRGRWLLACRANPAGFVIAWIGLGLSAWMSASAWLGRPFGCRSLERPIVTSVVSCSALSVLVWTIRWYIL